MRRLPVRKLTLMSLLASGLLPIAVQAATVTRPVEWTIGDLQFRGTLVHGEGGQDRPGLLMAPNWMGPTEQAVEHARSIAGDDYVVLVADLYGTAVRPENAEQAGAAAGALRSDPARLRARMEKALAVLREQSGHAPLDGTRVAAIGFCFGGTAALELARAGADIAAAVSFHGGLKTQQPAQKDALKASVLVLNGAADRAVPNEDVLAFWQEMDDAGADWMFVNLGGAVHCFSEPSAASPPNCVYDATAAERAFDTMDDFLADRFAAD